ncbi:flagellar basal body L-ring protein FlgH, partial [Erwinia amylovora]|uniref:flagellar basal body L-ring protein FlgH n=1 Tax=Erwinia amylovora TaxID=552 RepID=UPI00200A3257
NIGDTLTITQQEKESSINSSSAKSGRDCSSEFGLTATPRALVGLLGGDKANLGGIGKNDFEGKGGETDKNTFTGTITVTVNLVLPNGNL